VSECDREGLSGEAMTRNRVKAPQKTSFYCKIFMSVDGLKGCFDLLNVLFMENKGSGLGDLNDGLRM